MIDTVVIRSRAGAVDAAQLIRWALLGIPALWGIVYFFPPLNHDVSALLHFSERWLGGERLYVDLIDVNPPMIFVVDLVPVLASELTGLGTCTTFATFVLSLIAASAALSWRLVGRSPELAGPFARVLLPSATLFALIVWPMHSFGQREHLLLVLTLPYGALAASRMLALPVRRGEVVLAALMATVGVCLKPHFAALPLLVELAVLARVGLWRTLASPAPWLVLGGCVGYVLAVLIALPEYFDFVVPLVADYYAALEPGQILPMFLKDQTPPILIPLLILLPLAIRVARSPLALVLLAITAACLASGMVQAKNWDYHFVAAKAGLLLAGVALFADLADRFGRNAGTVLLAGGAAAVMALVLSLSGVLSPPFKGQRNFANSQAGALLPIVKQHAAGRPVLWLTSGIYPQFPTLNYADSTLAMRFMSLWLLPAIYAKEGPDPRQLYHRPEAMSPAERLIFHGTAADLARWQPALVVVDKASREGGFRGLPFDYLEYFGREPSFAREWINYRLLTQVGELAIYKRQ